MVRPAGFEPAASGVGVLRSIQMGYGRNKHKKYTKQCLISQQEFAILISVPNTEAYAEVAQR